MLSLVRSIPGHFVNCVSIFKVISVGVDANLCISDTFARTLVKHPPIPHGVNVVVATKTSANENDVYVALRYESKIEVWILGQTLKVNMNSEETMRSGWKNKYLPLKLGSRLQMTGISD